MSGNGWVTCTFPNTVFAYLNVNVSGCITWYMAHLDQLLAPRKCTWRLLRAKPSHWFLQGFGRVSGKQFGELVWTVCCLRTPMAGLWFKKLERCFKKHFILLRDLGRAQLVVHLWSMGHQLGWLRLEVPLLKWVQAVFGFFTAPFCMHYFYYQEKVIKRNMAHNSAGNDQCEWDFS